MNILRKLSLFICSVALVAVMTIIVLSQLVVRTIGNEALVKEQLQKSGIYTVAAQQMADQTKQNIPDVPTDNPLVKQAFEDTLNSSSIKRFSERTIESSFRWLRGEGSQPNAKLSGEIIKADFIDALTARLKEKYATLPPCPPRAQPTASDPLSLTCLPPGMTAEDLTASARQQMEASASSWNIESIEADALTNTDTPHSQLFSHLPEAYQRLKLVPIVGAGIAAVLIGLIVLLSQPKRRGLRTTGIAILPISLLLIVLGSIIPTFTYTITKPLSNTLQNNPFKEPIQNLANGLIGSTGSLLRSRGLIILLIAALLFAMYLVATFLHKASIKTGQISSRF